ARIGARTALGAARRQWPSVRRGAVVAGEVAFFLALTAAALLVSAATMAGRLLRLGFGAARRRAPMIAVLIRTSLVLCGRGLRRLGEVARQPRGESIELLDSPMRAELEAMHDENRGENRGQVLQGHIRAAPI